MAGYTNKSTTERVEVRRRIHLVNDFAESVAEKLFRPMYARRV